MGWDDAISVDGRYLRSPPSTVAAQVAPVDGAVVLASSARSANASLKMLRSSRLRDASVDTVGAKSGPLPQPLPTMYIRTYKFGCPQILILFQ